MGRNPVVGRQGPAYHAATIPSEQDAARLTVKHIPTTFRSAAPSARTPSALGLRHHQQTIEVSNTASVRGMLVKVRHLVEVTPVEKK